MKKHFHQQVQAIAAAYENLDDTSYNAFIEDCLKTINGGHSIIATALGKNVPVCEKFVGTLNSVGIKAHFMHTNSAVHGDLGVVGPEDLVVILSKSGETEETIYLSELLEKRGSLNWLLTCNPASRCGEIIKNQLVMKLDQEGDPWNLLPNNSTLIFLVFLQATCMEILDRLPVKLETFKANHPGGNIGKILVNRDE
jgi:arabinose-5-phosphate isomerase